MISREKKVVIGLFVILIFVTFLTNYYGSTDIGDYEDAAKYLAGSYKADIRNSHSYLYGFINAPFVYLFGSFVSFKILSLISLFCIIYSVYWISGKDKKALWLIVLSPAVWYIAPWSNPIQLASLCLLWGWYFIREFRFEDNWRNILYSGIFIGLGWALWNTILYFGIILVAIYLWDKKITDLILFLVGVFIGLIPLFLLDLYLFSFPFYSLIKTTTSNLVATFMGGIHGESVEGGRSYLRYLLVLSSLPLVFWTKLKEIKRSKDLLFIILTLLIILSNPQIRYVIAIIPIIVLFVYKKMDRRLFRNTLVFSIIISLIFITPYILQIGYHDSESIEGFEITSFISGEVSLSSDSPKKELIDSLVKIEEKYPGERFVVGPYQDSYADLARHYKGEKIIEFISIQDYDAWRSKDYTIFEKRIYSTSNFNDRRIVWIGGGMEISNKNKERFDEINYLISLEEMNHPDFQILDSAQGGFYIYKKY